MAQHLVISFGIVILEIFVARLGVYEYFRLKADNTQFRNILALIWHGMAFSVDISFSIIHCAFHISQSFSHAEHQPSLVLFFYTSTSALRILSPRCLWPYIPKKLAFLTEELHFFILHTVTSFAIYFKAAGQLNATIKNLILGGK